MSDSSSQQNFYTNNKKSDEVDFGKIFRLLMMQTKLIIFIVSISFIVSYLIYNTASKKYRIQSLLQFESVNQNIFDPSSSLQIGSVGAFSDFSNLISLYQSRTNYLKVITDLKLNLDIINIDNDEFIDINILSNEQNEFTKHKLKFSFSENGYSLLDKDQNEIQTSKYGEDIKFGDLKITINSSNLKKYRPIDIHFRHPDSLYNSLKASINVDTSSSISSWHSNNGLINISFISDDIDLGKKIINYANNIFLNQRIFVETEKSRKAIDFIDKNIESIRDIVEDSKIRLKEFREKNKSIDVDLEIGAIIAKIQSLDESLSSIDIEIAKALDKFTSNNPIYLNLLNEKKSIEKQRGDVLSEIEMMPKEQQEYIDLYNDLEVYQGLYKELESRRLGFSILEASTIGDIRVVDNAYVDSLVSPRFSYVLAFTLISFFIACFLALIRGFNFLPISNPAEIFDNNIHLPVLGVIPKADDIDSLSDIRLNSSMESLIININALKNNQPDKKLITITSPTPFNGKTTISRKLAEAFSKLDKKVLLVDNDLKRGKINKHFNIKSINENIFNSIDESTINEYMINDNLYIIPRVKNLNNTFQFLYNYTYRNKIEFFKDYFDYIIFDTGPILSVSDTSILIEQSDINLLVARHEISRINEIKQAIDNFKQINKNIDGIIYNGYARPNSYYGYYSLYGNYSYQYYADKYLYNDYEDDKKY